MDKIDRIKELVKLIDYHDNLYYNESRPEISDSEYDNLFYELRDLEKETGFVMAVSPTQTVGYEVKSSLSKVMHNHPMLSLDKTKNIDDVIKFLNGKDGVVMAKMDGLTCSVRYLNGKLVSAETRGNGEIGEDILHCAKAIKNLPLEINCLDEIIVDGEVIITYDDFEKINATLPEGERYKNPRNLASGSIRQLDSSVAANRNMKFIAWKLIKGYKNNSFYSRLIRMANWGFDIVPVALIPPAIQNNKQILDCINVMKNWAKKEGYPIDGCVFGYDDIAYGESLGATGHHLRSQLAFKFYDEEYETTLKDIEWTMGKTGVLTPTAVFDSVEIDGTEVSRASLSNVSVMYDTLGTPFIGQTVYVTKRNMIIPKIERAEKREYVRGNTTLGVPLTCPICGGWNTIQKENDSEVLVCTNPECNGKLLGRLNHFVSKKAMNIDGLSEATLDLLISNNYISKFVDIYHLSEHTNELAKLPGLGTKSVQKLIHSIEKSREVQLENFITALSIPNIGSSAAKTISKACDGDWNILWKMQNEQYDFTQLDDFGEVTAGSLVKYFDEYINDINRLAAEMHFITPEKYHSNDTVFTGKTIVVTGKLNHFTRDSINEKITSLGAKTAGSVSKNTDFLLTNEASGSSKYKKAIELGIPTINEEQFLRMIGE